MDNEELDGVKFSEFPSATPGDSDEVVGLHAGDNARFSVANFILAIRQGLANIFVPQTRTINGKALNNDISLSASDVGAVDTDDVGVADGVASLDSTGKVPGTQLDLSGKQSTITASGILKGDGQGGVSAATAGTDYQVPLTFDNTPTANSANPVKSGGVYADVRTRVPNYGMGVNLLRNWYFVGGGTGRGVFPVNQRGQSSYTAAGYTVDGWWNRGPLAVTVGSDSITISNTSGNTNWVQQFLPDLPEETFTIAILVTAVTGTVNLVMQTTTSPFQTPAVAEILSPGCVWASGTSVSGRKYRVGLYLTNNSSVTFKAVKLELGTEQTLAHLEGSTWVLNEIPDYEYELYRCITSTAESSDTYANKSLATEQQLAYVETGTTASRAYAVGEYFCWNGLLYRAKTAISSGASFTPGTNCEQVTDGGLNNVGFIDISSYISVNQSRLNNTRIKARYYPGSKKVELQAEGTVATTLSAGQNTLFLAASSYAPLSGVQQFAGCGVKNSQTAVAVWANSASINVQHGGASVGDKIAISLSWLLG